MISVIPGIEVIEAGLWTSIQDTGRKGYRALGVPEAGAADLQSLELANRLTGNDPGTAALEMTLQGPVMRSLVDLQAAVAGFSMAPRLNGAPIPIARTFLWPAGAILSFDSLAEGCRAYLAIEGGFLIEPVLKSRSTDVRAAMGGLGGRPLRAGDLLTCRECMDPSLEGRWAKQPVLDHFRTPVELRFLPGPEACRFPCDIVELFYASTFEVGHRFDRMGLVFDGPEIRMEPADIISSPTVFGTVQVPASGSPVLLMVDGQTSGGYNRLAVLISADRSAAAQLRPGSRVRPVLATPEGACLALRNQKAALDRHVFPGPQTLIAPV